MFKYLPQVYMKQHRSHKCKDILFSTDPQVFTTSISMIKLRGKGTNADNANNVTNV